eukprot:Sspe_Gene.34457::Locus_16748_Transcript_3_4_Confidence_0.400_Length_1053::g.34457::m.34457
MSFHTKCDTHFQGKCLLGPKCQHIHIFSLVRRRRKHRKSTPPPLEATNEMEMPPPLEDSDCDDYDSGSDQTSSRRDSSSDDCSSVTSSERTSKLPVGTFCQVPGVAALVTEAKKSAQSIPFPVPQAGLVPQVLVPSFSPSHLSTLPTALPVPMAVPMNQPLQIPRPVMMVPTAPGGAGQVAYIPVMC